MKEEKESIQAKSGSRTSLPGYIISVLLLVASPVVMFCAVQMITWLSGQKQLGHIMFRNVIKSLTEIPADYVIKKYVDLYSSAFCTDPHLSEDSMGSTGIWSTADRNYTGKLLCRYVPWAGIYAAGRSGNGNSSGCNGKLQFHGTAASQNNTVF